MAESKLERYISRDFGLKEASQVHPQVKYPVLVKGNDESSEKIFRMSWWPISEPFMMLKETHYHDFEQYLFFVGGDPTNLTDLGGEVELMLGESENEMEKFVFTEATAVYIPPGMRHGPLTFTRINDPGKPIMFHDYFMTGDYIRNIVSPGKGD